MEPESEEEVEQKLGDTRSVKSLNDSVKLSDSGWGDFHTHSQWKMKAPLHSSAAVRSGEGGFRQTRQTGQNKSSKFLLGGGSGSRGHQKSKNGTEVVLLKPQALKV